MIRNGLARFAGPAPITTPVYEPGFLIGAGAIPQPMPFEFGVCGYTTLPLHEIDVESFASLEEKQAHREALGAALAALASEIGGKRPSDEQKADLAALEAACITADAAIEEQAYILAMVDRYARNGNTEPGADQEPTVRRPGQPSRTSTARRAEAPRRVPENPFDMGAYYSIARSDDDRLALMRDGAKFGVEDMHFYNPRVDEKDQRAHVGELFDNIQEGPDALARHILSFGSEDYLRAFVFKAGEQSLDARAEHALALARPLAMELVTGSAGGFVSPVQLDPTLLPETNGAINELRTIARVERITGKQYEIVTSGGVQVRRGLEGSVMTASEPVLGKPTLGTVQVDGFIPFSFALGLAWQGILPALAAEMADAKDIEEAGSFIYGDGVDEEPGGLLETMPNESRIETTALSDTDLYGATGSHVNKLGPRFLKRASWLGSGGIYNEIRAIASESDGSALWTRLGDGRPDGLLGKRVYEQSTMPATSAGGEGVDDYLAIGDFSNFLIVDRIGMVVEIAQHLFRQQTAGAGFGVPTGQRGFIAHWHNNARILVPNAFRVLTRADLGS
jgi:HK97 family phage major capsid protein